MAKSISVSTDKLDEAKKTTLGAATKLHARSIVRQLVQKGLKLYTWKPETKQNRTKKGDDRNHRFNQAAS